MKRSRRSLVRNLVVLGLAGTMMAAALMSPALAVRLATTSYVKSKVNQAVAALRAESANKFVEDGLSYVRGTTATIAAGNFAQLAVACPAGTSVTGGGVGTGDPSVQDAELEASYPSNGASFSAGTTGWAVSIENPSGAGITAAVYAICAKSTGTASFTAGSTPAKVAISTR